AEALNLQLQYETVPSSKFHDLVYWRFYLTSPDFELIQTLVPDRRLDNGWAITGLVYADGSICLDILQNQWSPIYDVAAILTSIQSLLCDPNPNSPANSEAARKYSENKREYNRKVRDVVEQSWTATSSS
ncbi:hypothetical protein F2Q68_00012884, partial [Brassica cretica]